MRIKKDIGKIKNPTVAVLTIIFCLIAFGVEAQSLDKAKQLYNNKLYRSALSELDKFGKSPYKNSEVASEVEGYRTLSLIKLKSPSAHNAAEAFLREFSHSPLCEVINYNRAMLYFDDGEYAKAAEIFEVIDKRSISKSQRTGFNFKKGYCKMRTGYTDQAINIFNGIISEGNTTYLTPSLYYCGYLNYANKEFKKAIPLLERAKSDERFNLLSRYHLLESQFLLKNYDYVTQNGAKLYNETDNETRPKVARIVSEAYFALNQTEQARYYFELYTLSGSNLSRSDNFYAGMIAYTLNNHISATDAFAKVASSSDSIGQNAAYHMGQSYIQLKNKHAAQKAFKLASESNYDPAIREDALFNYAKLSFDINRNVVPFEQYLKLYPNSISKWDEIHTYIATEFLMNSNYADAIVALKKIKRETPQSMRTLQKASFLRAMQLIRNGSFSNAIPYLRSVADAPTGNNNLKNLGSFWLAEAYYRIDNFDKSMELLAQLQKSQHFRQSREYPTSLYNMAYNHFKKGDFAQAATTFQSYLALGESRLEYGYQARLRLADCHFMQKEYKEAAELYEKLAIENGYAQLYAPLQAAISYGLTDNNTKKSALLEEITTESPQHTQSPLYSQALYELARTFIKEVEDDKAERVLNRLIKNPKDSIYHYKALNEMGMIYSNRKDFDNALECYKSVVEKNPLSEEGQSALAGIENIYQRINKPQEFLAYLDNIGLSSIKSTDEKESMLFNSAEQIFLSGNYTAALASLTSFIEAYPNGSKAAQANFYIAECYNNEGKREKAAEYYYKVMETQDGSFSEIATLNYGNLSYILEQYVQAVNAYETLSKIAQLENNKIAAMEGKMKSYFKCRNFEQTIIEAKEILEESSIDAKLKRSAKYYLSKSYIVTDQREEALPLLNELALDKSDAFGAESAYLLIEDAYDSGNFSKVQELTFAFSDSGSPYAYWLAKSFIILGDSYVEQENIEQALATFNSVKENYKPQDEGDDIAGLLKMRLEKLSKMER